MTMLLTLRKLPVIGLSFVHIINSNMRDIHTARSDNFCCLHFLYSKYLQNRFVNKLPVVLPRTRF
jgi:hypothetical protein